MKTIPLTQGQYALVNDDDCEILSEYKWHAVKIGNTFYASRARPGDYKRIWMHREIMQPLPHLEVDHADGDGLNNQRANLRVCTHAENLRNQKLNKANTSGYKGVTWDARSGKWQAQIKFWQRHYVLGHFVNLEDAARARAEAERELFGDYTRELDHIVMMEVA